MKRTSNILPVALMLFLAALTLWLRFALDAGTVTEPGRDRHDPDAVVDGFTLTRLSEAGRPHYVLSARRMVHFPDDDSTHLEHPRLVKRGDGPAVTVSAERGTLRHGSEEAHFAGNVLLVREGSRERGELRVRTESLSVLADGNVARTRSAVSISDGRSQLSGTGMELDKRKRTFSIFADVRGRFESARR